VDVVEPVWDVSGSCEVWYGWCEWFPDVTSRVEDWTLILDVDVEDST
jgi:hypothetical protein